MFLVLPLLLLPSCSYAVKAPKKGQKGTISHNAPARAAAVCHVRAVTILLLPTPQMLACCQTQQACFANVPKPCASWHRKERAQ